MGPRSPAPALAALATWPGALLLGVGLQALDLGSALYFGPKAASASATYGVLGIGVVLLSWLVVLGWVVLLSAELNAGLHEWRRGHGAVPGRADAA